MKKEVLVFLSEDYGDWEGTYICSELNKPETGFAVKTMAIPKPFLNFFLPEGVSIASKSKKPA